MSRVRTVPVALVAGALSVGLAATPALATPALAVAAQPTSLTLKAAKTSVVHNQKTTLTGTLKSGTKRLSGDKVVLERRASGTKRWSVVSTKTTGTKGTVTYTVVPGTKKGQKEQYEVLFKGTSTYKPSHSAIITITVT